MRVFVTGATGVIGSQLVEGLVTEGYEIRALSRETSDISTLKSLDVEIAYGDINDSLVLERSVKGCHQVYHLAAKSSRLNCTRNEYYSVNVEGTRKVAYAALRGRVDRFIHCSTVGVYGYIENPPVNEATEPDPDSSYSTSKLLGEKIVLSFHRKMGLPVVITRISSLLGPRSPNWLRWIQDISKNRFRMIGSGENHIHMVYISDLVEGLKLCSRASDIEGQTYIIAGREPIKINRFLDLIAEELQVPTSFTKLSAFPFYPLKSLAGFLYKSLGVELGISNRLNTFLSNQIFDITKAQKDLGYSPKVSIREGVHNTVEWYRENGYI